jgi:transposase
VKRERLEWLADNPRFTRRFAMRVGRSCRVGTVADAAEDFHLDWHTVKELDKDYMREQLERAGPPNPRVVGIDEISVGKGHQYRIVVSDLIRGRAIWFGGRDRSEASMDGFYQWLGPAKSGKIRLAVMDMWKAFRKSTLKPGNAPQAAILYDKFHILKHLGEAMDKVRKQEYAGMTGGGGGSSRGRSTRCSRTGATSPTTGRKPCDSCSASTPGLNKAYLLKESFGQLWDYNSPAWASKFFDQWCYALRWQRLQPFRKFVKLVESHWDGIEAYCHAENKVPLGFVEGLNNKIRVIQRKAYGFRDEEYLRLKILTCMLPKL